jgi:hypothetical protein
MRGNSMSSENPSTENARSEEAPEPVSDPTMINVRSEGLKLDLVLLKNRFSGLTIDYQNVDKDFELRKWLRVIDWMLSGTAASSERSIPEVLGEAAGLPSSRPQIAKEEKLPERPPTARSSHLQDPTI